MSSPPAQASALCKAALGDAYLSASLTTVGEIRDWGHGPTNERPAENAFPGIADSEPAAWCWTGTPDHATDYGVAHGQAVKLMTVIGPNSSTPSGPPLVP